jgi:hypothetical protein
MNSRGSILFGGENFLLSIQTSSEVRENFFEKDMERDIPGVKAYET